MNASSSYPDLTEPGLRRKKRMTRKKWDNKADDALDQMVSKKTGANPFSKKKRGT